MALKIAERNPDAVLVLDRNIALLATSVPKITGRSSTNSERRPLATILRPSVKPWIYEMNSAFSPPDSLEKAALALTTKCAVCACPKQEKGD